MELVNICRICLKTKVQAKELETYVITAFKEIFKIEIDSGVDPPYLACTNCKLTLVKFYRFYVETLKNHYIFKEKHHLEAQQIKSEALEEEPQDIELNESLSLKHSREKTTHETILYRVNISSVSEVENFQEQEPLKVEDSISETDYPIENYFQDEMLQDIEQIKTQNNKEKRPRKRKLKQTTASIKKSSLSRTTSNQNNSCNLCTICGKTFVNIIKFDRHLKTSHIDVTIQRDRKTCMRLFLCDLCPRKAKSKTEIKDHIERVHLKIRKFVCQLCGDKFLGSNNLKFHLTTHDDARPRTQCPDCGVWVLDLKKHWRTSHNDTNPVVCPHCGVTLMNNKKLGFHIYKHHAAPGKYRCNECQKDFKNALYLKEHMHQKHIGGFLYRCEWCDFQTNYSKNMPQHQKTKHREEFEASRIAKLTANGPLPMSRLWQLKLEGQG